MQQHIYTLGAARFGEKKTIRKVGGKRFSCVRFTGHAVRIAQLVAHGRNFMNEISPSKFRQCLEFHRYYRNVGDLNDLGHRAKGDVVL